MATNVVSTTDSKEDVTHAMGMYSKKTGEDQPAPAAEKPVVETPEASGASENAKIATEAHDADDSDDGESEETAEGAIDAKPKKKGGFQKRIDKLTKERTLASQERDYWKEQALKAGTKPADEAVKAVETKTASAKDAKPNPDDFQTVGDYYEAVAEWKFEQKEKAKEQASLVARAKTEQEKTVTTFQSKVKEFQKTATDLHEVLENVDHIVLGPALQDIFLTSDNGPELMYDLAKDPAEYERINKMSPLAAAREMGKREAKMSSAVSSQEVTETKTTKAPPPVKPITGKSASVSTKDPGDMTYQEYKEWHKKKFGNG